MVKISYNELHELYLKGFIEDYTDASRSRLTRKLLIG